MAIEFACPKCSKRFRVKTELAGRVAKCECGSKLRIPKPKSASSSSASSVSLGDSLSAGGSAVGVASKSGVHVKKKPTKKAKPAAKAPAPPADDDLGSWMDEELDVAPPVKPAPFGTCPQCEAPLTDGAVICVACGWDSRTGKKLEVREEEQAKPKKKKASAVVGSFARGALYSLIAAVIGGVLWGIFVTSTGFSLRIIAWGIGGLAGVGMAFGHDDDDGTMAGLTAAGMTIVGVIVAKAIMVSATYSEFKEEAELDAPTIFRESLIEELTDQRLEANGISLDTEDEAAWEAWDKEYESTRAEVESEVAELTDEQVNMRLQEIVEAQGGEDFQDVDIQQAADTVENVVFGAMLLFSLLHPFNLLWMAIGCGTAYKLGSGRMTDD